jgi:hypothetical protein
MTERIVYTPNLLDRLVGYISPEQGLKRLQAGQRLATVNAWLGASKRKKSLKNWRTSKGDADTDLQCDLLTLRERSRDLTRNNPLALGAINTNVTNVIGSGLRLHSHIDRDVLRLNDEKADRFELIVEREWSLWAESTDCDIARTLTFSALQSLVFRSVLENGDAFALLTWRKLTGRPYGTAVQLMPTGSAILITRLIRTPCIWGWKRHPTALPKPIMWLTVTRAVLLPDPTGGIPFRRSRLADGATCCTFTGLCGLVRVGVCRIWPL